MLPTLPTACSQQLSMLLDILHKQEMHGRVLILYMVAEMLGVDCALIGIILNNSSSLVKLDSLTKCKLLQARVNF